MPQRVRVTPSGRQRMYLTRHMWADEDKGEIYVEDNVVEAARALGYVEDIVETPTSQARFRRRGRPPKSAASELKSAAEPEEAPEPEETENADPAFDHMNVADLRAAAELRGLQLDTRYYRRDELIAMLKGD